LSIFLKRKKTLFFTAFVIHRESNTCEKRMWKVLSKTSKGRYLDFKRASLASQKGVNWKPIYALFVCSLRILFTKVILLVKAIENLKDRSVRKSIVLLFPYLNLIQLLFFLLCLSFLPPTRNSLPCQLVTLSTKETFFCYSVFILPCLCFVCYPVLILLCLKVV